LEMQTASRLQMAPAGCGALHTCGVKAKMQTLPSLQSLSAWHSSLAASAEKPTCDTDIDAIIAIDNKSFLTMFLPSGLIVDVAQAFRPRR
jgi:hypothetical protein